MPPAARIMTAVFASVLTVGAASCGEHHGDSGDAADTVRHLPDTLRVATLYSPTSYFIYREEKMGYDYTLVSDFCRDKGIVLDLHVAPSLTTALSWADSGIVDLVAYEVPVTQQYNRTVTHCGPVTVTEQVLVQPRSDSALITDVTQLVGRDVYVEKDSKYADRLANLNSELGGGIRIHSVDRDTLITEDLLAMVAEGLIPLTVVDSDVASLNKTYYPGLDITLSLSFGQRSSWAVSHSNKWLADSIDAWFDADRPRGLAAAVYKRYFEMSKSMPAPVTVDLSKGHISPYDGLFRKYASQIGWDWRLVASLGFVESRFNSGVVSWAGARGIMQIMPGTARANGYSPEALADPETSIRIAVKLLGLLDKSMRQYVSDKYQRQLFVLAAYNAGVAHIVDAIALARKYGHNPSVWHGNVEAALQMKADPVYYNDPVVKYGYFRGRQTVQHVTQVENFYLQAKKKIRP